MEIEEERMKKFFLTAALFMHVLAGHAQVTNDNISRRSQLELDADFTPSSTEESTVEWKCINQALTRKCVVYHNDQWFFFQVPTAGKYFLNIGSTACRDGRGIQAIVIEGNPCEISTYTVLHCLSQIRREDVYITLDSLKAGTKYLLNIDGFLGDFCGFNLQLATAPKGFPVQARDLDTLSITSEQRGKIFTLRWETNESIVSQLDHFEIQRTIHHKRFPNVSIEFNAAGAPQTVYTIVDTIQEAGSYEYEIAGVFMDGRKEILGKHSVYRDAITIEPHLPLEIPLTYKNNTPLRILLMDKRRNRILQQTSFRLSNRQTSYSIDAYKYFMLGMRAFIVRSINLKTGEERDHEFVVNDDESVTTYKPLSN